MTNFPDDRDSAGPLVLGSGSPRRADLLRQLGLHFEVRPPDIDERPHEGESPTDYVARMARSKVSAVQDIVGDHRLVLCADTTVTRDGMILGKPRDRQTCVDMLMTLSNASHEVLTGVSLTDGRRTRQTVVETIVRFRPLTIEECNDYWSTGEPVDKAGGYGIQGMGAVLVQSISGSYSNVVGLPLTETAMMLRELGIDCLKGGWGEPAERRDTS
ncbi:MAG: Maf family protein [Gammaproteobacteria bacterium]|nr:Maf family protein [Gammaproteobacteria bacterium]